jgi:prevent-host-death family protein
MEQVTVGASEFKAKCLRMLDEVAKSGRALVITKHGKPVARVTPVQPQESLEGSWKGLVEIKGDLVNADTSGEWETLREWDELNK